MKSDVQIDKATIKAIESVLAKGERTITPRQTWYRCPYCKKNLFLVTEKTIARYLYYRCKACKHDIEVNI